MNVNLQVVKTDLAQFAPNCVTPSILQCWGIKIDVNLLVVKTDLAQFAPNRNYLYSVMLCCHITTFVHRILGGAIPAMLGCHICPSIECSRHSGTFYMDIDGYLGIRDCHWQWQ